MYIITSSSVLGFYVHIKLIFWWCLISTWIISFSTYRNAILPATQFLFLRGKFSLHFLKMFLLNVDILVDTFSFSTLNIFLNCLLVSIVSGENQLLISLEFLVCSGLFFSASFFVFVFTYGEYNVSGYGSFCG